MCVHTFFGNFVHAYTAGVCMGLYVRRRKDYWILQKDHFVNGKRTQPVIPKEEYPQYALCTEMTITEARQQIKRLNEELRKERLARKRETIDERLAQESKEQIPYLPQALCYTFEKELESLPDPRRLKTLWRAARKLIKDVNIPCHEWKRRAQTIYNYFEKKHLSPDYAKKVIRLMNMWGEFYAAKTRSPYSHLKSPTGFAAGRIRKTYKKHLTCNKASEGLTPELLQKHSFRPEQYNWLFISLWFGLRPQEIENLKRGNEYFNFDRDYETNLEILCVLQTKLSNLPEEDQWKSIPIIYPEQIEAASIIRTGNFIKPLGKTIKRHTHGQHHLYAGRKGFGPLMWGKGHDVVEVSSWLGHKSIDRTYRDYMSWRKVKVRMK